MTTEPAGATVEANGRTFTFRLYRDEWICFASFGSVDVGEISVLDVSGLPDWVSSGLTSLMDSFPEKVALAQSRLDALARQLFADAVPAVLVFDLIGVWLLDAERYQLEFSMRPEADAWFDTYGLWVATFQGGSLSETRRDQG